MPSKRPSLVEGAIRPGGDPNEKSTDSNCTTNQCTTSVRDVRLECQDDTNSPENKETFSVEDEIFFEEDILILFKLFEVALTSRVTDPEAQRRTEHLFPIQKDLSAPIWHDIQEWFSDHPSQVYRHAAATLRGPFSMVPLHLLCQHPNPPLGVVINLVNSAPEATRYIDDNGWLPLHYACCWHCVDLIEVLLEVNPKGALVQDKQLRSPLHFAVSKSGSGTNTTHSTEEENMKQFKTVEMLTDLYSEVVEITDEKGRTPLHYAASYGASQESLQKLVEANPEVVNAKEHLGRFPLHYVMANCPRLTSPVTLKFLLDRSNEKNIHATDNEGNIPLQLLTRKAANYNPRDDNPSRQNMEACLNIYLNAKPPSKHVPEFCATLQSLPRWLREFSVTNENVRYILNKNICKRFPTM